MFIEKPFLDFLLTESKFSDEEIHAEVKSFMFAVCKGENVSFKVVILRQIFFIKKKFFVSRAMIRQQVPLVFVFTY